MTDSHARVNRVQSGVDQIAAERQRQRRKEHYTAAHDDQHDLGEIAIAAACYALPPGKRNAEILGRPLFRYLWPPDWQFKGAPPYGATIDDRIRDLAKAGALIAAEIDRLERTR